jgi:hypothetical protein
MSAVDYGGNNRNYEKLREYVKLSKSIYPQNLGPLG